MKDLNISNDIFFMEDIHNISIELIDIIEEELQPALKQISEDKREQLIENDLFDAIVSYLEAKLKAMDYKGYN